MAKRIYVGNLPRSFSSSELEALFSTYGEVRSAEVISDRMTGESRGFGFVEMDNQQAAQEAMQALDGSDVQGRRLTVNEARERAPRGPGGGRPGGGPGRFGGGGGGGRGRPRGGGYGRDY
jgi:RNA recognition motif-containing protein